MDNGIFIEAIKYRSAQGVTRPFVCLGADGHSYFVKGNSAGMGSQIAEWVAGRIAQELGLNVPTFAQTIVESGLIENSVREDIRQLGAGRWFGSQEAPNVQEINLSVMPLIETDIQALLFLFDWWVKNGDRSLTEHGGNPNLLWSMDCENMIVIDHNNAFDASVSAKDLLSTHIFRDESVRIATTWRQAFEPKILEVHGMISAIWDEMPESWRTAPRTLSIENVRAILDRPLITPDSFWTLES